MVTMQHLIVIVSSSLQIVPHMPEERVNGFFREVDADFDNRISYRDFEMMMKQFLIP